MTHNQDTRPSLKRNIQRQNQRVTRLFFAANAIIIFLICILFPILFFIYR